jgi:predicted metal-dependent hydrolase
MSDVIDNAATELSAWPPPYTIKRHARARHVKLRASAEQGLVITVPPRFNVKHIPDVLQENQHWIQKQLAKLPIAKNIDVLPDTIVFPAIQQSVNIQYIPSLSKLQLIARPHREIVLLGNIDNKTLCCEFLTRWVKLQAKKHLVALLQQVSQQTKLAFKRASIRDQKTRWGSCTSQKVISLSYKILFLPAELATHILIHELCHTKHLDHSDQFWNLVASFDPQWEQHRREIRQAPHLHMPEWLV